MAEYSWPNRKVALKILPQHLSERAELKERFEREARAVSSLNHPHICTLYDTVNRWVISNLQNSQNGT